MLGTIWKFIALSSGMQDLLSFYWNNTKDEEKEGRGERELGGRADQLEGPFWLCIKASPPQAKPAAGDARRIRRSAILPR